MFNLSITKRYIPAVILLSIFIVLSHLLINKIINSNNELANIINISGKQRMLSQRLLVLGQSYYEKPKYKPQLQEIIDEIKNSHDYLITKILTKEIHKIYYEENLDKNLKEYIKNFENLLLLYNPIFLKIAREQTYKILKQLDQVVKEYEKYSNQKTKKISEYEFYILLATLFILLLEVLFIFKPAAIKIDRYTKMLLKNKEYEEAVIESNNNAIIAIDRTFKITTYNKKAEEIFGWTKDEMLGSRNLLKIIPSKYKNAHIKASKSFMETGRSCGIINKQHELEAIRRDGTIFPIEISFGVKIKKDMVLVVANISDITNRKKIEEELRRSEKMASMGEMLESIAHQWRQPLSIISSSASGLRLKHENKLLNNNDIELFTDNIVESSEYLSDTIEVFRNFMKEDKVYKNIMIQNEIDNAISIMSSILENNHISMKTNIDYEKKIYLKMAKGELTQVIINIINNAKDALIENKIDNAYIKLKLVQKTDKIVISIEDNAKGIAKKNISKIFDPYFTTKHSSTGTGLGLHMCYKIVVESFKGNIYVKNTENGAKFFIEIPFSKEDLY